MTERMMQVPKWMVEHAEQYLRTAGFIGLANDFDDLLSQPTPSAEKPRFEDMAPGACEECGGTGVCGGPPDRYYDCPRCSGGPVDLDDTRDDRDPSTIRDVTPPS